MHVVLHEFTIFPGHTDSAPVTVTITDVLPTTTVTVTMSTLPSIYSNINSFMDDPGNLAWLIPAILLGALALGLGAFMCFRCFKTGACAGMRKGSENTLVFLNHVNGLYIYSGNC